MAKTHDFRLQTGVAPATPVTGVASYYVNASGVLRFVHANGTSYVASTFYPTNITGVNTGTANVSLWIPVVGPSGQLLAIPAYSRTPDGALGA
jgi:hypothetical protein